MTNTVPASTARPPRPGAAVLLVALLVSFAACGGDANNARPSNSSESAAGASAPASTTARAGEVVNFDAEIERLEKEAGKNPGNPETLAELARAYVRRGNALRDAGRLREAMNDYRSAQSKDPDNEEAQTNAADIAPRVEGAPTGEYGEPAPPPISPNVTGAEDKPSPTATPKKAQ